jgi:hypothetical protein
VLKPVLLAAPGMLLITVASSAEAQYPTTYGSSGRTTSAVDQLPLADTVSTAPKAGRIRQLVCRGAAGVQIATQQDPSPSSQRYVTVSLSYRRNSKPVGSAYEQLEPGACSWNPLGDTGIPAEPGVVQFDLDRQGSAETPEPGTLALWLGDPRHYWLFYVDDATNVSISHGAYGSRFYAANELRDKRPTSTATALRRERLRCRGGKSLAFTRGARQGNNLVAMTLAYRVAFSPAGPAGKGLEAGTCAWADRTNARQEPGRIGFTTAGNAQLKQVQSGSQVDRSPTAAERWPDVHSIPTYMADTGHYWTFTVSLAQPATALGHRLWKPFIPDLATPEAMPTPSTTVERADPGPADPFDRERSTTRAGSTIDDAGERREDADPTSNIGQAWRLHGVTTSTLLETATVRFLARPGANATVRLGTEPPRDEPGGTGFKSSIGMPINLYVHETREALASAYTAVPQAPLQRGTRYYYLIDVPADGDRYRREQFQGEVRTWRQTAQVVFTEIYIVSDGDTEGPGDLQFTFKAEDSHLTLGQDVDGGLQWHDGSRNQISLPITGLTQDRIRIHVSGVDDDQVRTSRTPTSDPCVDSYAPVGKNQLYEWNCARTEVDLTQHPGGSANIPLYFRSMPLRNGSTLMFDVRGYVSLRRE